MTIKRKHIIEVVFQLVVYVDDFVATFQYEQDAISFLSAISERFALFGLELEPIKTSLVEFGRNMEANRKARNYTYGLNRRSQRKSYNCEGFKQLLRFFSLA